MNKPLILVVENEKPMIIVFIQQVRERQQY